MDNVLQTHWKRTTNWQRKFENLLTRIEHRQYNLHWIDLYGKYVSKDDRHIVRNSRILLMD